MMFKSFISKTLRTYKPNRNNLKTCIKHIKPIKTKSKIFTLKDEINYIQKLKKEIDHILKT